MHKHLLFFFIRNLEFKKKSEYLEFGDDQYDDGQELVIIMKTTITVGCHLSKVDLEVRLQKGLRFKLRESQRLGEDQKLRFKMMTLNLSWLRRIGHRHERHRGGVVGAFDGCQDNLFKIIIICST